MHATKKLKYFKESRALQNRLNKHATAKASWHPLISPAGFEMLVVSAGSMLCKKSAAVLISAVATRDQRGHGPLKPLPPVLMHAERASNESTVWRHLVYTGERQKGAFSPFRACNLHACVRWQSLVGFSLQQLGPCIWNWFRTSWSPAQLPKFTPSQNKKGWSLLRQACSQAGAYSRDRAHAIGCRLSCPFAESGVGNMMWVPESITNPGCSFALSACKRPVR